MRTNLNEQISEFLSNVARFGKTGDLLNAKLAACALSQDLLEYAINNQVDESEIVGELWLIDGRFYGQLSLLVDPYVVSDSTGYLPPWSFEGWREDLPQELDAYCVASLVIWILDRY